MQNTPLPQEVLSKDFILSPVQGMLNQRIPRLMEFGKGSTLNMGLDDGADQKLDIAATKKPGAKVEPEESTILDLFASMLISHVAGFLFHSPGLEMAVEVGLETHNAAVDANHAVKRAAGMAPVMAMDPAAQMDPNLVFLPNGQVSSLPQIPTLSRLGTKIDAQNDKKPTSTGTRKVVRFGKRGSSWA